MSGSQVINEAKVISLSLQQTNVSIISICAATLTHENHLPSSNFVRYCELLLWNMKESPRGFVTLGKQTHFGIWSTL